ncbi:MAG: anthranilate 1,2-dioxygenase large subunit [Gammaproteobacteria bacterium]
MFSDEEIYAQEQEKIFRGPVWNLLCMEFDVAQPGDFKTTFVGETPVIVTRDHDGELHALVNRCAHKGALVCLRDAYHATLLHTFYTTFKVNRLDMDGGIIIAPDKWHHISHAKRKTLNEDEEYQKAEVHSAQFDSKLEGPQLLDTWDEFEDGITHSIQAFFPNLCIHFTLNSLCVGRYLPRGVDKTELFWIYLGYERDTEEETEKRVMQVNLTGSAGLVSMEDGCINNFVQRGTRGSEDRSAFVEMGGRGRDDESSENSRATEAAVRGFWTGYRRIMRF